MEFSDSLAIYAGCAPSGNIHSTRYLLNTCLLQGRFRPQMPRSVTEPGVDDLAFTIDDVRKWQGAASIVFVRDLLRGVGGVENHGVGYAELAHGGQGDRSAVNAVEAEEHQAFVLVLFVEFLEMNHLLAAGRSSALPEVQPNDLASVVREPDPPSVCRGQVEVRCLRARFQ